MQSDRLDDAHIFYELLGRLVTKNPPRQLGPTSGRDDWPDRGVYFFFEGGEDRTDGTPRVVRIGTHGLAEGSSSTLWKRLSQHRGTLTPKGGNHRGSVFRELVGAALLAKEGTTVETWGKRKISAVELGASERPLEEAVSDRIGAMRVAWLDIPDEPGPHSLRGLIERSAIALLSNYDRSPIDPPSPSWLGLASDRERVRKSGLWNNNHVAETYDPEFLTVLEALIEQRLALQERSLETASAAPILVMQCAKSKNSGGRFQASDGTALAFVADPALAPPAPDMRAVHPDSVDYNGVTWRQRLLDYNRTHAATGANPFGLHAAADLYMNPSYGAVADALPADRFYILSACWGLVRSDFLLPNYDVSYSRTQVVPAHAIRHGDCGWDDYNMLDLNETAPLIFIGGQSYLEAFERLSRDYLGPKIAYHNLSHPPVLDGVEMRRFATTTKTNWHYALANMLANGQVPSREEMTASPPAAATHLGSTGRTSHGKYSALHGHLSNLRAAQSNVTLTYLEIERVLGAPLPRSSRTHAAVWWANGGHSQAHAWLDAGFRKVAHRVGTSDDLSWIRFERTK